MTRKEHKSLSEFFEKILPRCLLAKILASWPPLFYEFPTIKLPSFQQFHGRLEEF